MCELWLKYKDNNGAEKRVRVDGQKFIVGRHSTTDLSIVDGRLSREHLKIERFGDLFMATDCGSSNGSKINDVPLDSPVALKNGDLLDLGGLKIEAELNGTNGAAEPATPIDDKHAAVQPEAAAANTNVYAGPSNGSIPTSIFFIAPILGLLVLSLVGGLIYFSSGKTKNDVAANEFQYSDDADDLPLKNKPVRETDASPSVSGSPVARNASIISTNSTPDLPPATPADSESAKVEQNGTAFLRKAAQNDAKAFLTGEQAKRVGVRIKQLSGNSALAANISSARQNSSQITSLAKSTNLQPQFLAVAAITKLGSSRGDVAKVAQSMAGTLDKLRTQIGSELAEDTLLMIAAYDQGEAGDFMKLRNMLQDLANKYPDSSRSIRTVWFLQQNGKITQSEFDMAVTFLAIGTISQNPKAFGVNAEALTF
ncbi:MAG: FHA domain-containing protein [Acidobacteriota bacterium]